MSTTCTSPACCLPGAIQCPGLAAANVTVALATTDTRAASPVEASTPLAMSALTIGTSSTAIASIASAAGPRGSPCEARAEDRVDDDRGVAERVGVERLVRAVEPLQVGRCVALVLGGVGEQQDAHGPAQLAQQAPGDEPVAAVVALAADDRDRAARDEAVGLQRQAGAGALHEIERRHAALLDRPAVGRAHLLGAGQRLEPVGQRPGHERTSATAPAVALECVIEMSTSTPSAASSPCSATRVAAPSPTTSMSW